jgi:O-antigen ligase
VTAVYLKEMIVALVIATVVFRIAKPIALRFGTEADFLRRRNVWFGLTVAAFLSPNFWLFVLVAFPLLIWAGRKDTNPIALYLLLLHVIPPIPISVPIVGVHALFEVDNYRLLSFSVLIPTALRLQKTTIANRRSSFDAMDILLLGWGVVFVFQFIPPDLPGHVLLKDSFTNLLRRAFLFFVDVYVLYFVVSRSCSDRRAILDAQAAFCLSCAILSSIAVFEFARNWLIYADLATRWSGDPAFAFYLRRGDSLRAQAAAGHSLALGYLIAIAFGFWLYLKSHVPPSLSKFAIPVLFWLGLFATYSRGPWIGALAIYLLFVALGPRALPGLVKSVVMVACVAGAIVVSPLGDRIISVLPFMGGAVDVGSITYRQRLAERAWELIQQSPFFGDQLAYLKMEDLRQGQGIIDLVNTYAEVALFHGFIGLALFIGLLIFGLLKAYRMTKARMRSDPDFGLLGLSLVTTIVGTLIMMISCSFIMGYEKMFYILAGLATAYIRLGRKPQQPAQIQAKARASRVWEPQ